MASSSRYWTFASDVQTEVNRLKEFADEMFGDLEAADDPGDLAAALNTLQRDLAKLSGEIAPSVEVLKKLDETLETLPVLGKAK